MPRGSGGGSVRAGGTYVDVNADVGGYTRGMQRVQNQNRRFVQSQRQVQRSVDRTRNSFAGLQSVMRQFLVLSSTIFVIGAGVAQIARAADSFTLYRNRIREATSALQGFRAGEEQVESIHRRLLAVSREVRTELGGIIDLYSRIAQSAQDLNQQVPDVIAFVRSLSQAAQLSGATQQETINALIQLSQGISSGELRGEELRSVLENLGPVADIIADQLGATRGELLQLSKDGQVTAQDILDAFANAAEDIQERFDQTTQTIGQSFTNLATELNFLFGAGATGSGVTGAIASSIQFIANNVGALGLVISTFGGLLLGRGVRGLARYAQGLRRTARAQVALRQASVVAAQAEVTRLNQLRNIAALSGDTAGGVALTRAHAAATERLAQRQRRLARATSLSARAGRAFNRVFAAMGGWIGIITTAITVASTAFLIFGNRLTSGMSEAEERLERARDLAIEILEGADGLTEQQRLLQELEADAAGYRERIAETNAEIERMMAFVRGGGLPPGAFFSLTTELEDNIALLQQTEAAIQGIRDAQRIVSTPQEGDRFTRGELDELTRFSNQQVGQITKLRDAFQEALQRPLLEVDSSGVRSGVRGFFDNIRAEISRQRRANRQQAQILALADPADQADLRAQFGVYNQIQDERIRVERELSDARIVLTEATDAQAAAEARFREIGQGFTDRDRERLELAQSNAAQARENVLALEEESAALDAAAGSADELAAAQGRAARAAAELEARNRTLSDTFVQGLQNSIRSTEDSLVSLATFGPFSFKRFARAILEDITRIIIRLTIVHALFRALGFNTFTGAFIPDSFLGNIAGRFGVDVPTAHEGGLGKNAPVRRHSLPLRSDEMFAIIKRDEDILPAWHPRHSRNFKGYPVFHEGRFEGPAFGGGRMRFEVINQTAAPVRIADVSQRIQLGETVVGIVIENYRAGGPIREMIDQSRRSL